MKNKLTIFEALSIIAIITIAQIILNYPEYLIDITGTRNSCKSNDFKHIFFNYLFNNFKYF